MEDFAVAFALLEGGALEGEALEGFDLGKEWTGEESIEGGLEGGRFFGYGAFGFPEASAEDFFTEIAEVVEGKLEEAIGRGIEGIEDQSLYARTDSPKNSREKKSWQHGQEGYVRER